MRRWRRTGLALGWIALAVMAAALLVWLLGRDQPRVVWGALQFASLVVGMVAVAFLRRAWAVPTVADQAAVVRLRGWSDAAVAVCAAGMLVRALFDGVLGVAGTWLDVVLGAILALLAVVFVVVQMLATRWRPEAGDQL